MMAMNRVNRFGRGYRLTEVFGPKVQTEVRYEDKKMMFNVDIRRMVGAWSEWMNGKYIQDAFPFLTPAEREFLMTGILPKEWDEMFKEEEPNG